MERMQRICPYCSGRGVILRYIHASEPNDEGLATLKPEEITCDECGGQGHTEYAIFSVEEAEAILKHCGLNT